MLIKYFVLTFDTNTPSSTPPVLASDANRDIAKYLGFNSGANITSVSSIRESINVVDQQRYDILYIRSDIANNGGDDLLAEIYVGSSIDLSMIKYVTPDAVRHSVGLADNVQSCAQFSLTDDNRKTVEMNGVNFRFVVQAFKSGEKIN